MVETAVGPMLTEGGPPNETGGPGPYVGVGRQWYLVFALVILTMVATLDRQCLALLAPSIKHDLKLSDTGLSFLLGASFVIFQTLTTVPMGWLVDRYSRKGIIGLGLLAWSLATFASGFATNFWQLFVGRAGVGFSEGGLGPAGFSLIRETVAPVRRGRAFALQGMGSLLGNAAAFGLGGVIVGMVGTQSHLWPIVGQVRPWQISLMVIGLIGLPFGLLVLPIAEPMKARAPEPFLQGYKDALSFMAGRWTLYVPLILFMSFLGMMGGAFVSWLPSVNNRNFGMPMADIGKGLGAALAICFPLGMVLSGFIIDGLRKRGNRKSAAYVALGAMIATLIPTTLMPLMHNVQAFWALTYFALFTLALSLPAGANLMALITPKLAAGRIQAVYILVQAVVGVAGGPFVAGVLSDTVFKGAGKYSLGLAISFSGAIFMALGIACVLWLLRGLRVFEPEDE